MRLTDATIRNLRFDGKQRKIFDDGLPNFGVRVYQSGIAFIVMLGTERRMRTVGKYPQMSLKAARKAAVGILGTDTPPASKSSEEAISAFLEHCERTTAPRTAKDYKRLLNRHFPEGKMEKVTRARLLAILSQLSATPGEQSHTFTAFNVFLNWCVADGIIQGNPLSGIRGIGRIKTRERILTTDELRTLYKRAHDYPHPFGNIVLLCILTGQRRSEIAHLQWSWIGTDTITLPSAITKNRREHTFPIGPLTRSTLDAIPRTGDLLFEGRFGNVWNGWSKSKKDFDPLASQWQLHDIRRTYRTLHGQLGTPPHIGERLVNHVSTHQTEMQRVYDLYSYLPEMREAVHRYEYFIGSLT